MQNAVRPRPGSTSRGAIGLERNVPTDEDQLRPETRSILMAPAAFIVNDCHATRCDLCLHQRVQFSLG